VTNVDIVHGIYEAFGRGDIPAIINCLSADVEWEYGHVSTDVPWLQPLRGASQVPRFFESLGALEFHRFQPKAVLANGDLVVALCDVEATIKATGQRIVEEDEVHIWYFDSSHTVRRFRHRVDTHQMWRACQAVSA
jgi:ketosteroid isomerase-like protein